MELNDKPKAYLSAAAQVSSTSGRVFRLSEVCRCLQWDHSECRRVAQLLEKEGLLNRLPDDEGILTTAGLKAAGKP